MVSAAAGIDLWRDNSGLCGPELLVCRLCGSVYAAVYDLKDYTADYADRANWKDIIPTSEWDAPPPILCPDCGGSGYGPERVVRYGEMDRLTTTCEFCHGLGKTDARAVEERRERLDRVTEVIDDLASGE